MEDKIVFTRKEGKYTPLGKSVGMREAEWLQIKDIAELTGMTMTDVATELAAFALKHVSYR